MKVLNMKQINIKLVKIFKFVKLFKFYYSYFSVRKLISLKFTKTFIIQTAYKIQMLSTRFFFVLKKFLPLISKVDD